MKGAPVLATSTGAFIAGHGSETIDQKTFGDEGTKNFSVSNESLYESYWKVERKAEAAAAAAEAEPKTPVVPASPAPTHLDSTNKEAHDKNGLGGGENGEKTPSEPKDVASPSYAPSATPSTTTTSSTKFDKYYHKNLGGKCKLYDLLALGR